MHPESSNNRASVFDIAFLICCPTLWRNNKRAVNYHGSLSLVHHWFMGWNDFSVSLLGN